MGKVDIVTAQNVKISYKLANIGDRIAAYLIDLIIIYAILIISFYAYSQVDISFRNEYMWIPFLLLIPLFFYHLVLELLFNGQTFGKKMLKIRVVKLDGSSAGIGNYIIRWMFRIVDFGLMGGTIAFLFVLFSKKGQRLGDMVAGTTVISLVNVTNFLKTHSTNLVNDSYQPVFLEAAQLSPEHIRLIEKAIKAKRDNLNEKPVDLIAERTKKMLNIESDFTNLKFLHTIVKDYNYYTSKSDTYS